MIEPLYRYTSVAMVEQLSTFDPTLSSPFITLNPAAGAYDILVGLPTIHARSVTVFLEASVALNSVQLRKWAANRSIDAFTTVSGALAAGVTLQAIDTTSFGETLDLRVNKGVTGAGTICVWICARG